ncbi:MAG: class I SAM-dependent methyltransferase [Candidatus Bathyarchaeia archaeon]|jgi:ubiquinone/menaquinone biosynthesis C-methylase UbiE
MASSTRKKTVQRYYSIRAKDYDQQKSRTWKSENGFGAEILDEVLNAFTGFESKLLLEVGVGSGRNAKPLLEKIRPCLVGLDLTREMLNNARNKLLAYKQHSDLILGDADHLPFAAEAFDGILCMSTMHYFEDQERTLEDYRRLLKEGGTFVYGDLSPHDADDQKFFETLERTISRAHTRYYKASETKRLLETHGFHVSRMKTIAYKKPYDALIEDKGKYFAIKPEVLRRYVHAASKEAKEQYVLTDTELTQFYTVITATREN